MKLYDRLMSGEEVEIRTMPPEVYSPPKGATQQLIDNLPTILQSATRVNIQNVADYAREHATLNGRLPEAANGRAPWPITWSEYRLDGADYGVLSTSFGLNTESGVVHQRHQVFVGQPFKGRTAIFYIADIESWCDEQGAPLPVGENGEQFRLIGHTPQEPEQPLQDKIENAAAGATQVILLAMTFANCKNVFLQEHHTPPKVARKRAKAGKPIGTSYKTLLIDPMREVLKTEGNVEKNGLKKALHICRGHFATYTDDKPLFGKVTGTFWKPMHVRGSKERGEVKKDYVIGAPNP